MTDVIKNNSIKSSENKENNKENSFPINTESSLKSDSKNDNTNNLTNKIFSHSSNEKFIPFTSATFVKKDEPFDVALKRFKRKNFGIISEVRKREAYVKPSVKRKTKSKEARRRKKGFFKK